MFFKKNQINVEELHKQLDGVNIIDVRTPEEYNEYHIPNAQNIPMNTLIVGHAGFLDKDVEYYIICLSGSRSQEVINHLKHLGYILYNVRGGTSEYIRKFGRE